MILQEFLPAFHYSERHETMVHALPHVVYNCARSANFSGSFVIRTLLRLRELPGRLAGPDADRKGLGFTFDDFVAAGFVRLAEDPPSEFVLGAVGRFWKARPEFLDLSPEEFKPFDRPGCVKVAFNIRIEETKPGLCRVSTESRILCLDDGSRRRFRYYWALIRPFSGLIRRVMLRTIRRASEESR